MIYQEEPVLFPREADTPASLPSCPRVLPLTFTCGERGAVPRFFRFRFWMARLIVTQTRQDAVLVLQYRYVALFFYVFVFG